MDRRVLLAISVLVGLLLWLLWPASEPPTGSNSPSPTPSPAPPRAPEGQPLRSAVIPCGVGLLALDHLGEPFEGHLFAQVRRPDSSRPFSSVGPVPGPRLPLGVPCGDWELLLERADQRSPPLLVPVTATQPPGQVEASFAAPCSVRFSVVDGEGAPVLDARAGVNPGQVTAEPDPDGVFRLPWCVGPAARAIFEAPGFATAVVPVPPDDSLKEVVLEPAVVLRGQVLIEDDSDIAVRVRGGLGTRDCAREGDGWVCDGWEQRPLMVESDCGGDWLDGRMRRARVWEPERGFTIACEEPPEEVGGPREAPSGEARVEVLVLGPDGPAADVLLDLTPVTGDLTLPARSRTGPDGLAAFERLGQGSWMLQGRGVGGQIEPVSFELAEGAELSLSADLRMGPDCDVVVTRIVGDRVYVVLVPHGSPAWESGLRPWMALETVQGREALELFPAELAALLAPAPGQQVDLRADGADFRWTCPQ